jgi:hypothetical protein
MSPKIRLIYYFNNLISVSIIFYAVLNIKDIIINYYDLKQQNAYEQVKKCHSYFIWKISLFINLFFLFASFLFTGYLLYKRNSNYDRVIFIRVGPTVDTIILIFLILTTIIFGPLLVTEIFIMMSYYDEIVHHCKLIQIDVKYLFIPYFILCFFISLMMTALMFLLCSRRCSRTRLMRRRNISFIGEFIETM